MNISKNDVSSSIEPSGIEQRAAPRQRRAHRATAAAQAAPARRRRLWIAGTAATAVIALGGALAILQSPHAVATPAEAAPPATPVSVATVVQRDVAVWQAFSGRLEAVERVDVRARVSGAVQSVHFREGALVDKGALLLTIDPAPYAAEVDRLEAQVISAQARLTYTRSERERADRLWQDRAIAQRELDDRVNGFAEAEAQLRAAQAALRAARLDLGYTQLRAPVAGRVGRLEVTVGNLVSAGPGAPVLTTLFSVSPIYASFDADEQTVAQALAASRTTLERIPVRMGTVADAETPHEGRLQLVDNQVDAASGTVRVRAVFDNRDGVLMPGQFARVRMGRAQSTPALLVSERAIGTDQDKKFVLVVGDDQKASYREVTLGAPVDGMRMVTSGLKADERIVVNGLHRVRPGATLAPQPVAMDGKPVASAGEPPAPPKS